MSSAAFRKIAAITLLSLPILSSCGRTVAAAAPAPAPDPAIAIRARADSIAAAKAAAAALAEKTREATTLRSARPEDVGMNPAVLDSMDGVINQMLRDGAAPGAAIAIG